MLIKCRITAAIPCLDHHSNPNIILLLNTESHRLDATSLISLLTDSECTIVCIEVGYAPDACQPCAANSASTPSGCLTYSNRGGEGATSL